MSAPAICKRCGREVVAGLPSPCPACSQPPMLDPAWTPAKGYGHAQALLAALGASVLLALAFAAGASASPPQPLDVVASGIAGHPVSVDCVSDWPSWGALLQQHGFALDASGLEVEAFTVLPGDVIYLGPTVCPELTQMEERLPPAPYLAGRALLALAHEAVHQRGVTDEGVTDCTALGLVRSTAEALGIPATVRQAHRIWIRRHGHRVRVIRRRVVANPWLAQAQVGAEQWHRLKPPAYQGDC